MHYNLEIVDRQIPFESFPAGTQKLGRKAKSHNLFRIRTSEKCVHNSFVIRTSKSKGLKVLYNPQFQNKGREGWLRLTRPPYIGGPS
jgi:hypothetical protein